MEFWMIYIILALAAIVLEIIIPTLFCINFAIAGVITAIISIFWGSTVSLLWTFFGLSIISILFIKPILEKTIRRENEVNFDAQYIGKIVKCTEPISTNKGAITIYDERWEARLETEGEEIQAGSDVKIVKYDNTTLFVEKI